MVAQLSYRQPLKRLLHTFKGAVFSSGNTRLEKLKGIEVDLKYVQPLAIAVQIKQGGNSVFVNIKNLTRRRLWNSTRLRVTVTHWIRLSTLMNPCAWSVKFCTSKLSTGMMYSCSHEWLPLGLFVDRHVRGLRRLEVWTTSSPTWRCEASERDDSE